MWKTGAIASFMLVLAHLTASPALAYVGPGAGITMLGALWGVLIAILLALWAVLYWPVRAMLRKRRQQRSTSESAPTAVRAADGGQGEHEF